MTYPKYYKSIAHDVKLVSPKVTVWVSKDNIEAPPFPMEDVVKKMKYPESTESEFKKAFNKTSKYLKSLI